MYVIIYIYIYTRYIYIYTHTYIYIYIHICRYNTIVLFVSPSCPRRWRGCARRITSGKRRSDLSEKCLWGFVWGYMKKY